MAEKLLSITLMLFFAGLFSLVWLVARKYFFREAKVLEREYGPVWWFKIYQVNEIARSNFNSFMFWAGVLFLVAWAIFFNLLEPYIPLFL